MDYFVSLKLLEEQLRALNHCLLYYQALLLSEELVSADGTHLSKTALSGDEREDRPSKLSGSYQQNTPIPVPIPAPALVYWRKPSSILRPRKELEVDPSYSTTSQELATNWAKVMSTCPPSMHSSYIEQNCRDTLPATLSIDASVQLRVQYDRIQKWPTHRVLILSTHFRNSSSLLWVSQTISAPY